MRVGEFGTAWDEDRRPLDDEAMDSERRARYWRWNASAAPDRYPDASPPHATAPDGRTWHLLSDAGNADVEAFHMRHSIGYNWDHYSGMGEIHSLRSNGIPDATVLVADGTVVHARRAENVPLEPADLAALAALAEDRGWDVLPPDLL